MKYFIGYSIRDEAKNYQENLIEVISKKFGTKNLNEKHPPHLTIKAPFETDISQVENIVGKVCRSFLPFEIEIKGVGSFDKRVIFLDVAENKNSEELAKKLINELSKEIEGLEFSEYDYHRVLHATLSIAGNNEQFLKIMDFLKDENPEFKMRFDCLTIFEKNDGKWREYKKFKLG